MCVKALQPLSEKIEAYQNSSKNPGAWREPQVPSTHRSSSENLNSAFSLLSFTFIFSCTYLFLSLLNLSDQSNAKARNAGTLSTEVEESDISTKVVTEPESRK